MSRNQFRLLVVVNQLLILLTIVVQDISDKSLPPELKSYFGMDESVLNTQVTSVSPLSDVPYWIGTALLFSGAVASVGLFLGKRWGRSLFLLTWLAMLLLTLSTEVYINTGWTSFVSYLVGTTDGMILGLVYFSHVKRIFEHSPEANAQI
jgi:hypothetical protein